MFGFGTKGKAKSLMKTISKFSNILSYRKEVFPSGGDESKIECVLVGLSTFLTAGFSDDKNLVFELPPAYQRKIMSSVDEIEYNRRSQLIQDYYLEFRETAIYYQENVEDWIVPLCKKFAEMTAIKLNVDINDDSISTLTACILELINNINPKLKI